MEDGGGGCFTFGPILGPQGTQPVVVFPWAWLLPSNPGRPRLLRMHILMQWPGQASAEIRTKGCLRCPLPWTDTGPLQGRWSGPAWLVQCPPGLSPSLLQTERLSQFLTDSILVPFSSIGKPAFQKENLPARSLFLVTQQEFHWDHFYNW